MTFLAMPFLHTFSSQRLHAFQLVKDVLVCIVTTHRKDRIFLSVLLSAQVLTLTSGLLPVDLGGCGTPANWEPGMWFYQYK